MYVYTRLGHRSSHDAVPQGLVRGTLAHVRCFLLSSHLVRTLAQPRSHRDSSEALTFVLRVCIAPFTVSMFLRTYACEY